MESAKSQLVSRGLYDKRNAMGLLAHLLIEQHETFLALNQSREVDLSYDRLTACLFGNRPELDDGSVQFKTLREKLEPLIEPLLLAELDRVFSCISETYTA